MKRRVFIQTAPAVALALAGCGGGGGGAITGEVTPTDAALGSEATAQAAVKNAASGSGYLFGSRLDAYVAGIKPSNATPEQMDATIRSCYDAWKSKSIATVPTVPGGLAVRFGNSGDVLTVSEGMGYGMLLAVVMHGHDPGAKALFDGLLTTVRARPAMGVVNAIGDLGKYLMDWRLAIDGRSTDSNNIGWNAMDGDQDIAMALLMADRQWGSTGTWNYKQEGINTINAMKRWNMKPDGTTMGMSTPHVSRISDYMIGHFRAYQKATGDDFWNLAIDRSYALVERMQNVFSPTHGLMPDFIVATDTAAPYPSPGGMGDFVDTEMHYYANSQRNPWRWGCDYVLSGDERWKKVCDRLTDFFKNDTGGDPARTATGYRLDGSPLDRPFPAWSPGGMIGPQLCGAMVDARHQDYLNALWTFNATRFDNSYYTAELQLLPMIVAAGNWWNP
jgi:endoglucanase